ncbi:MAG: LTA synthase family protein [Lentisphaerae bacterium]|nr:LTA synthase family protein [Lentisphaerota bacterium]
MFHRLACFISTRRIFRRVIPYAFILAILLREAFTAYYDEYAAVLADSRAIVCWIFVLFCLRLTTRKNRFRGIGVIFTSLLCLILVLHTAFIHGNGNGFSLENCIHILDSNMLIEFIKMSPSAFIGLVLLVVLLTVLIHWMVFLLFWSVHPLPGKPYLKIISICGFFLSAGLLLFFFYPFRDIYALFRASAIVKFDKNAYSSFGIKVTPIKESEFTATPGKNLVLIVLESTEKTYLDEKIFPGLVPNLKKFSQETQLFSNITENKTATGTIGSLFSMMNGFYITTHYITFSINGFRPYAGNQLSSFPKILNRAGYKQYYLVGHSGNFAGMERFIKDQRYDEAWFGIERAKREKSWKLAVRDSAVFEQAWKYFQKAAAENKPFNITVLTIDAHGPDGYYDPKEPGYPGKAGNLQNLYNAMYASDRALGKFLDRVRNSPAGKNTCIVITNDHLAHNYTRSTPLLEKNPDRKMLFMIWNSAVKSFDPEIAGVTFDMAPTILRALGVHHNYLFPLGEDLYAGSTDRRRLNYTVDQENALNMYVKLKSVRPVKLPQDISIQETPYPMLKIGEMFTPLVIKGDVVDLPKENDILKLSIPDSYQISEPEVLTVNGFSALEKDIGEGKNFVLFMKNNSTSADFFKKQEKTGYLLGIFIGGKSLIKCTKRISDLKISAGEIRDLMKGGTR